jgi:tetratricopeptide (TPR) repeat protein
MRVALGPLLFLACAACANTPQREETTAPLVVPPLAPDAATPIAATEPRAAIVSPLAVPARDPRPGMRSPRPASELRSEIAALEKETTASSLHALADAYCELARVERANDAREKAIAAYEDLVSGFPAYAALDEALYFAGLESEILGDRSKARRFYYELIQRRPDSPYVPYAYFAFGELFFEEGKLDPTRNVLAGHAFAEAVKFPQSPIASEARSRLDDLKKR